MRRFLNLIPGQCFMDGGRKLMRAPIYQINLSIKQVLSIFCRDKNSYLEIKNG